MGRRTIQVKTNQSVAMIEFRREADLILVLKVDFDEIWEEI